MKYSLTVGLCSAVCAVGLAVAPAAMAQTPTGTAQPTGSLQMSHNAWRTSKLDGATVYNSAGDSIGTIDDLLISKSGHVQDAVLSVGGFLGIGDKLVEVPFTKLKFQASKSNTNGNSQDYSVVLPNASKASLKDMVSFSY
jgi:sporulation protein YlmC with PRC-barrel domain